MQKKTNAENIFLTRYVISIVKDCTIVEECDFLLAVYGYLDGYESLNLMKRYAKYCENVGIYDENIQQDVPLSEYWDDIKGSMINKKNTCIRHLIKELNRRIEEKNDTLPYINKAIELMEHPYPTPNYLLEKGYRKCEIDGKVFFVPLSYKELRTQANIPILTDNSIGKNASDDSIQSSNPSQSTEAETEDGKM